MVAIAALLRETRGAALGSGVMAALGLTVATGVGVAVGAALGPGVTVGVPVGRGTGGRLGRGTSSFPGTVTGLSSDEPVASSTGAAGEAKTNGAVKAIPDSTKNGTAATLTAECQSIPGKYASSSGSAQVPIRLCRRHTSSEPPGVVMRLPAGGPIEPYPLIDTPFRVRRAPQMPVRPLPPRLARLVSRRWPERRQGYWTPTSKC